MNNKTQLIRFFLLLALVLTAFAGWFLAPVNNTLTDSENCDLTEQVCIFDKGSNRFSIEFTHKPVSEEELTVKFNLPSNWVIEKAWIEGVNMYMGKTPVMFENVNKATQGVTFLGSCNLAQMKWLMFVELRQKNTTNVETLVASFSTYQ